MLGKKIEHVWRNEDVAGWWTTWASMRQMAFDFACGAPAQSDLSYAAFRIFI
jgi:hypothetical protein